MFQDKAQTAKNGPVLLKGCNTVLGHLGTSEPVIIMLKEYEVVYCVKRAKICALNDRV